MKTPRIVKIRNIKGHKVLALWNDGNSRLHNFEPEVVAWRNYVGYRRLSDSSVFKTAIVNDEGCLSWPHITYDEEASDNQDDWITFDSDRMFEEGELYEERNPALKLAQVVSSIRLKLGLTQEQVAIRTGVTKSYISKIERGVTDINLGTFEWLLEQGFGKRIEIVDIEPQQENTGDNQ